MKISVREGRIHTADIEPLHPTQHLDNDPSALHPDTSTHSEPIESSSIVFHIEEPTTRAHAHAGTTGVVQGEDVEMELEVEGDEGVSLQENCSLYDDTGYDTFDMLNTATGNDSISHFSC